MQDSISIDWQSDRLSCVEGVATATGAKIRRCFQIRWPEELDISDNPSRAGQWLAKQFANQRVKARHVLVSLPRQEVMVRNLSVPDVEDEQLPDLVRLQAETISAASLDDQILDYLPPPRASDSTSRQVLMVTLARQKLDQIRKTIDAAGLALSQVGVSCIATAELVAHSDKDGVATAQGVTLVVDKHEGRLEVSLLRDGQLMVMHASRLADESGNSTSRAEWAEIRRAVGSALRTDANSSVTHAWLVGSGSDPSLAQLLKEQFSCNISQIDLKLTTGVEYSCAPEVVDDGFYASALGMLLASGEPVVESIDFLRPRRTPEQINHGKRRMMAFVGSALVALVLAYGATQWRVSALAAEIDAKQADVTRMSTAIEAGQPLLKAANTLQLWEKDTVDWLQLFSQVNEILPGTDRIYLSDCQFKTLAAASKAQVQATGHAKTRRDVEQLYQRLAKQGFQVRPQEIGQTADDDDYPFSFRIDVIAP